MKQALLPPAECRFSLRSNEQRRQRQRQRVSPPFLSLNYFMQPGNRTRRDNILASCNIAEQQDYVQNASSHGVRHKHHNHSFVKSVAIQSFHLAQKRADRFAEYIDAGNGACNERTRDKVGRVLLNESIVCTSVTPWVCRFTRIFANGY